jgi:regulator of sigma E protease
MSHLISVLMNILPAIVVFGALIIVHEWGHFIACRLTGVKVEKFSIGFGPELFHWQSKETRFAVSLLPLGGFVSPAGEDSSKVSAEGPKAGDFLAASVWSRIFIVVAGVVMNFVLAFALYTAVFMVGRPMPGNVIGGFIKGYPAETSGLKVKDRIFKINDTSVMNWKEVLDALDKSQDGSIRVAIQRDGKDLVIELQPKADTTKDIFGKPVKMRRIGITPDMNVTIQEKYPFVPALQKSWETVVFQTVMTYKAIYYICTRQLSPKNLMGPLGIIQITGQAAKAGVAAILQLMAILSVSLAAINLFPFPALDGGHLFFLFIEAIVRKPIPHKIQDKITTAGFVLLMGLMALVFYNDIVNLQILDKIKNLLHLTGK